MASEIVYMYTKGVNKSESIFSIW